MVLKRSGMSRSGRSKQVCMNWTGGLNAAQWPHGEFHENCWASAKSWVSNGGWIAVWLWPFQECTWKEVVKVNLFSRQNPSCIFNWSFCVGWEIQESWTRREISGVRYWRRGKEKRENSQKLWIKSVLFQRNSNLISTESHKLKCLSHLYANLWRNIITRFCKWIESNF